MPINEIQKLKNKAKLLQKAKKRAGISLPLRVVFQTLAKAAGFASWRDLKANLKENPDFFPAGASAFWKVWYASYGEAVAHLTERGWYLLPYRKQFFVCEAEYLAFLGMEANDPDLLKVGPNIAEPKDRAAWESLKRKFRRPYVFHLILHPRLGFWSASGVLFCRSASIAARRSAPSLGWSFPGRAPSSCPR